MSGNAFDLDVRVTSPSTASLDRAPASISSLLTRAVCTRVTCKANCTYVCTTVCTSGICPKEHSH
ncbi:FDLD family class I lanthipeptide [Streptomyces sp. NPDC001606]